MLGPPYKQSLLYNYLSRENPTPLLLAYQSQHAGSSCPRYVRAMLLLRNARDELRSSDFGQSCLNCLQRSARELMLVVDDQGVLQPLLSDGLEAGAEFHVVGRVLGKFPAVLFQVSWSAVPVKCKSLLHQS